MKIAYVLNTYPEGSHSFIRREIAALEQRGHSITRIAMRRPARTPTDPLDVAEAGQTSYVLEQGAAKIAGTSVRRFLNHFQSTGRALRLGLGLGRSSDTGRMKHLFYFAEACKVAQHCADQQVDHIHAHFGTNAATVAMLASTMSGIPYSFTVHGPEEFDRPEALGLGTKIARSAFTVAISQFGRSQLCRWAEPDHWGKIRVVHCGIDPDKFPERDVRPLPDGPLQLVNIGRFAEQKGQLLLIEAMAQVVRVLPDCHLTLVGDGALRARLEATIARHGLGANVTLAGWLNEDKVRAALWESHALVLPSFAEGLPMVVMEAMAAARPVITTYIAGTPELVQDGKTGFLVPAGDAGSLCTAIQDYAAMTEDTRTQMGQAARQRVLERHDINDLAEQLESGFAMR